MNIFYLLELTNHIILCLRNYQMYIVVDITAKRRRHQLSLHPSSDVSPRYARYILGVMWQVVVINHFVYVRLLPFWSAAYPRVCAASFRALPLKPPSFSILIEMGNFCTKTLMKDRCLPASFP